MKYNVKYKIEELLEALAKYNKNQEDEALNWLNKNAEYTHYVFFTTLEINCIDKNITHCAFATITGREINGDYRVLLENEYIDGWKEVTYISKKLWRFERDFNSNRIRRVLEMEV